MISDEAFKRIHARLQKPFVKRVAKSDEERRREDFEFMVTCAAKGNMAMYELLRDRSLDKPANEEAKP